MNTRKVIVKEAVRVELAGTTKDAVLEELIDVLVAAGKIPDRKAALKAIYDREKKMSTGLQNGIAIPHGKTDTIDGLIAALGIKRDGIDFDSLDGHPTRIFLLTLCPSNRTGPHIQFLADVSRTLHNDELRQRLLDATSADEVIEILAADAT